MSTLTKTPKILTTAAIIAIAALFISCGNPGTSVPNLDNNPDGTPSETPPPNSPEQSDGCIGPDQRRGFNFVCWYKGCFQESEIQNSLEALREIGGNWLAIVPTWYQDSKSSNRIYEHPAKSPTASDLRAVVALARSLDFKVLFKPHIDSFCGCWRGSLAPSDLDAWHASYKNFILTIASLAEELDIEILAIGTELKSRSGDTEFWRGLIPEIKNLYSGKLTYAANWDEYESVAFWDLLDFIGVDFYFPLSDDPDAGRDELQSSLVIIGDELGDFSREKIKSVLFTEIGYTDKNGTVTKPYYYSGEGQSDPNEQADAYHSVLSSYKNAAWLEGLFWWRWDIRLEGAEDEGYLVYGKPAADVLKDFWKDATCD